ncbi:hypothetical protein P2318_31240 [Myxococcaceae bacterium GXIMD 01537]
MSSKGPVGGTLAIEVHIRAEAASGLKSLGHQLDRQIAELRRMGEQALVLKGPARASKLADYKKLRGETEYRKWCLIVQREAMGLYNHDDVHEIYRVPPALD